MEKEYYLCSQKAIDILKPKEVSKGLSKYDGKNYIAVLDFDEVTNIYNKLSEEEQDEFYVQEIVEGQIYCDDFDYNEYNLFDYINNVLSFGKIENECYCIYSIARNEGLNPLELFNKLYCYE